MTAAASNTIREPVSQKQELNELLLIAADTGDLDGVKQALQNGAEIDARDYIGQSAMHHAARSGHEGVLQYLADNGGNTKAIDLDGRTILHVAVAGRKNNTTRLAIELGVGVDSQCCNGDTPLHFTALTGNCDGIEILRQSGANPTIENRENWTPARLAIFMQHSDAASELAKAEKAYTPSKSRPVRGMKPSI